MQTRNRVFDDLSRMAGGALGAAQGIRDEVDNMVRQAFERMMPDMEMVSREEFEAVKAMAAKAREENDALKSRLDALEEKLTASSKK